MTRLITTSLALFALAGSASAAGFIASTDRAAYTGTVTRYGSLADAQSSTNAIGGPYAIPNRVTDVPFNTGSRDLGLYFVHDAPSYAAVNANVLLTAWWYTTEANTNGFPKDDPAGDRYQSGWGNPSNGNTGFLQMYDADGSTDTAMNGSFGAWNGTHWTSFAITASGANADYANDFSRLWHAPNTGGAGNLTIGTFISWDLNVTFTGLEGVDLGGGAIESNNHPTGVTGSFLAIFQNQSVSDPSLNDFYVADFTFNLDNWAFGQGDEALNGDFSPSLFAVVPTPGAVTLMSTAGLVVLRRRRA